MKPKPGCKTCGSTTTSLTAGGFCFNPIECDKRRQDRFKPKGKCIVKFQRYGATYYLEEFLERSTDINFVISPPRRHYQAVLEKGSATTFDADEAIELAKHFGGEVVEKK